MNDIVLLHRAVLSQPEEDTPRLMLADALEESEPQRAEFIRVQCELAPLRAMGCHEGETCNNTGTCSECNRDVIAEPLRRHERHLLDFHGYGWCDDLLGNGWKTSGRHKEKQSVIACYCRGMELTGVFTMEFSRGFISSLTCTAEDWLTHADALYWHPTQTVEEPLTYEEREPYACKVCGNVPDVYGCIEHGKGCYTQDENGGGSSYEELPQNLVPRDVPPTAQPITRITLTTVPTYFYQRTLADGKYVDTPHPFNEPLEEIKRRLEERFRGITFTLPPVPWYAGDITLTPHTLSGIAHVPAELLADAALAVPLLPPPEFT